MSRLPTKQGWGRCAHHLDERTASAIYVGSGTPLLMRPPPVGPGSGRGRQVVEVDLVFLDDLAVEDGQVAERFVEEQAFQEVRPLRTQPLLDQARALLRSGENVALACRLDTVALPGRRAARTAVQP